MDNMEDYYGTSSFVTSYYPASGFGPTTSTTTSGSTGWKASYSMKILNAQKKQEEARKKRLAKRTLADLSDDSKQILMKHARQLLREYEQERGWKIMFRGFAWFMFFLGLAIWLNFGKLLTVIQSFAQCK